MQRTTRRLFVGSLVSLVGFGPLTAGAVDKKHIGNDRAVGASGVARLINERAVVIKTDLTPGDEFAYTGIISSTHNALVEIDGNPVWLYCLIERPGAFAVPDDDDVVSNAPNRDPIFCVYVPNILSARQVADKHFPATVVIETVSIEAPVRYGPSGESIWPVFTGSIAVDSADLRVSFGAQPVDEDHITAREQVASIVEMPDGTYLAVSPCF